jgi:hypothetical protein
MASEVTGTTTLAPINITPEHKKVCTDLIQGIRGIIMILVGEVISYDELENSKKLCYIETMIGHTDAWKTYKSWCTDRDVGPIDLYIAYTKSLKLSPELETVYLLIDCFSSKQLIQLKTVMSNSDHKKSDILDIVRTVHGWEEYVDICTNKYDVVPIDTFYEKLTTTIMPLIDTIIADTQDGEAMISYRHFQQKYNKITS